MSQEFGEKSSLLASKIYAWSYANSTFIQNKLLQAHTWSDTIEHKVEKFMGVHCYSEVCNLSLQVFTTIKIAYDSNELNNSEKEKYKEYASFSSHLLQKDNSFALVI